MALTKLDLQRIQKMINVSNSELKERIEKTAKKIKSDLAEFFIQEVDFEEKVRKVVKEEVGYLPTKDEFYAETSKILAKLDEITDEKDVLAHQVSENRDRIGNVLY